MDSSRKANALLFVFLILLIGITPIWNISNNISRFDMFFSYNQYIYFNDRPDCVNLPIFLSIYAGHLIVLLSEKLSISPIFLANIGVAVIQYLGALSIYFALKGKLPKNILLIGIAFGLLHEKATTGFNMFFYSFLSMYSFAFLLLSLIYGIEKRKGCFIFLSGIIAGFAVFIRISNVIYLLSYIILFIGKETRDSYKNNILFCLLGVIIGIIASLSIIQSTIGFDAYMQVFDVIVDSSIDSHDVSSLLIFTFNGLIEGIKIAILVSISAFAISFVRKHAYRNLNAAFILAFAMAITIIFLASRGGGLINITQQRAQYVVFLLSCFAAVFFCIAACMACMQKREPAFWRHYAIACAFFCCLGPFGSNTTFTLASYGSQFFYPLLFFSVYRMAKSRGKGRIIIESAPSAGMSLCGLYGCASILVLFTAAVNMADHWQYPFFSQKKQIYTLACPSPF